MTWRYSAKHDEVRKARTLVSEEWLEKALATLTKEVRLLMVANITAAVKESRLNLTSSRGSGK